MSTSSVLEGREKQHLVVTYLLQELQCPDLEQNYLLIESYQPDASSHQYLNRDVYYVIKPQESLIFNTGPESRKCVGNGYWINSLLPNFGNSIFEKNFASTQMYSITMLGPR